MVKASTEAGLTSKICKTRKKVKNKMLSILEIIFVGNARRKVSADVDVAFNTSTAVMFLRGRSPKIRGFFLGLALYLPISRMHE